MNGIRQIWNSVFLGMPPAVRGIVLAVSAGGIAGIILLLHTMGYTGPVFYWSITIGIIVIALLGGIIAGIFKWRKKRQARAASSVIKNSAGGAEGVSTPDEIARLDQLRKDWDAAVKKFEDNNDDGLYSLPWYLLVGEPGSGKTEAIRHSGIPFPTGLNKPNQGTGGTYNMDWWFANDAVIIDTAGRLLFNETREWTELLTRLGKLRPLCPINGMLLVIPTDSLLKDTSQEIETKASRIAEQINSIKRELGIRFPVFVVITKADYITGFREYFSHLDDPSLEHQMLGWSNPHSLDEPFNPDLVDEHLESVSERLRRRRTAMLLDPPLVDETSDRTTDQVDALYAFPEEIKRIKNRLRLYMEQIFTPGPWSKKPPFIRGIYFTSSMQEGKELDTALAELLNIDVAELPEGRVWKKDKAYFLRDLFMQKVFPEKGLVTRAVNATQNYRRNKLIVNTVGLVAIVLSVTFGILALMSFRETVGQAQLWWDQVAGASEEGLPSLVQGRDEAAAEYGGEQRVRLGNEEKKLAQLLEDSSTFAERSIAPRGLLRPIEFLFRGDIDGEARRTNAAMVNFLALAPLADQARQRLEQGWSPTAADGVAQLLRMTRFATMGLSDREQWSKSPKVEPILQLAFDSRAYEGDLSSLQRAVDVVYSPRGYTAIEAAAIERAARLGLERWQSHWTGQAAGEGGLLWQLAQLRDSLDAFDTAERQLQSIVVIDQLCPRMEHAWREQYEKVAEARASLDAAAAPFQAAGGAGILAAVQQELEAFKDNLKREYELLAAELPSAEDGVRNAESLVVLRTRLDNVWEEIRSERFNEGDEMVAAIGQYNANFLASVGEGVPAFAARGDQYRAINEELTRPVVEGVTLLTLDENAAAIDQRLVDLRGNVTGSALRYTTGAAEVDGPRTAQLKQLLDCGCDTAERVQVERLLEAVSLPTSSDAVSQLVQSAAGASEPMPRIALTVLASSSDSRSYDPRFDPAAASSVIRGWLRVEAQGDSRVTASHRSAFADYVGRYVRYWTSDVPAMARFSAPATWSDLQLSLGGLYVDEVNESLKAVGSRILAALEVFDAIDDDDAWPEAQRKAVEAIAAVNNDLERQDRLREDYRNLRSTWRLESADLRSRILRMDAVTFTEQFFPRDYDEGADGGVLNYWNSFSLGCLQMLANDALGEIENARRLLATTYNRFPLVADGDVESALTVAQMRDADRQVQVLQRAGAAGGQAGGRTIGAGERTRRHRRIDAELDRLCGIDGGGQWQDDQASRDRRQAVGLITAALAGNEPLTAEVVAWGDMGERQSSAVGPHEAFELVVDGKTFARQQTYQHNELNDMQFAVTREQQLRLDLGQLDGELATRTTLGGAWPLLAAMVANGDGAECEGGKCTTWDVRFDVEDGTEFWVRIRFNQPLPLRTHWPTSDTWPFK